MKQQQSKWITLFGGSEAKEDQKEVEMAEMPRPEADGVQHKASLRSETSIVADKWETLNSTPSIHESNVNYHAMEMGDPSSKNDNGQFGIFCDPECGGDDGGTRPWWIPGAFRKGPLDDARLDGDYVTAPDGLKKKRSCCTCDSRTKWGIVGLLCFIGFLGVAYDIAMRLGYDLFVITRNTGQIDWEEEINVALVGGAYLYVNDISRVMEAVSSGHVNQQSCIHPGGSLARVLASGNGMYQAWQTENAIKWTSANNNYNADDYFNNNDDDDGDGSYVLYDYGACTVAQMLQGYDEYIGYQNPTGAYYDDGLNPCIVDEKYANIIQYEFLKDGKPEWDYVVIADQTKRMAVAESRNETLESLEYGLAPFLQSNGAVPVLVDTHAFWSNSTDMSQFTDIPTFTNMIYEGMEEYQAVLSEILPKEQTPLVAPIGMAYLTIWEEDHDLWLELFMEDGVHSSTKGTYLFSLVLYGTLFGHMPDHDVSIPDDTEELFAFSRRVLGEEITYPTTDEAKYMHNVASRVALNGYIPSSLRKVRSGRWN